jgi:hypothetical protein
LTAVPARPGRQLQHQAGLAHAHVPTQQHGTLLAHSLTHLNQCSLCELGNIFSVKQIFATGLIRFVSIVKYFPSG